MPRTITQMVVYVKSLDRHPTSCFAIVCDPTGEMGACIDTEVLFIIYYFKFIRKQRFSQCIYQKQKQVFESMDPFVGGRHRKQRYEDITAGTCLTLREVTVFYPSNHQSMII